MATFIFDWKRTLYDPDNRLLLSGACELVTELHTKGHKLVLIGKGDEDMYQEVDRLGMRDLFSEVIFKEGAKDNELFKPFVTPDPKDTIFIGDRVRSELAVGNSLHATTIWVRQGKFASEEPENDEQEPTYTVSSLAEIPPLLQSKKI